MMKRTNVQLFRPYRDGVILKKLTIEDRYIKKTSTTFYTSNDVYFQSC